MDAFNIVIRYCTLSKHLWAGQKLGRRWRFKLQAWAEIKIPQPVPLNLSALISYSILNKLIKTGFLNERYRL